jgi:nucleoside 2-deoxyribosyltransferase
MPEKNSRDIVSSRKDRWISQWMDVLMSSYPQESARFFRETSDPFANPVGAAFRKGVRNLFEVLEADDYDPEAAKQALDPMIRVRAIQEMAPSEALGFIPQIKSIMEADTRLLESGDARVIRVRQIAGHADKALLTAFDLYMACKKHVYTLRAQQARDGVRQLLIKKELISELPDIDPALVE